MITALNMNWNEYADVVKKATNGNVHLTVTDGEWDYLCDTDFCYNMNEIHNMVEQYLHVKIVNIIIDISNEKDCVIIEIEKDNSYIYHDDSVIELEQ